MSLKQLVYALIACVTLSQVGLRCARAEPDYEITLEDEFGNTLQRFRHRGEVFSWTAARGLVSSARPPNALHAREPVLSRKRA